MTDRATVLAFDTSGPHCAAALITGGRIVANRHEDMAKGQVERLMPLLEEVLAEAGLEWRDLDAIGVGIGPGNFTGVRISVSAARGLALALDIPAIGVTTFEALTCGHPNETLASVDARQDKVYVSHPVLGHVGPVTLAELKLPSTGARPDVVGHRAEEIAGLSGGDALKPVVPIAEAIARRSGALFGAPHPRPAPLYIRPADAAPSRDAPPVLLD